MSRTELLLIAAIVLLVVYEIIALVRKQPEMPTISHIVWSATAASPLVPLFFGLLMGHFFWQRHCDAVLLGIMK